jgi:hypothetical protein
MTKGGWSSPFAPWVIKSWEQASKENGWDEIAKEVKQNILTKTKEYKKSSLSRKLDNMTDEYKVEIIYEQTGTSEKPPGQFPGGSPKTMVRVTHVETGIMAQSGNLVSPFKNKQLAIDMIEHALKKIQD